MWAHWAFKNSSEDLEQGDILRPTPELKNLLQTYHPHYANHRDNKFYIVLTQSCDLVWRNGGIKARYIAIAPVRPLDAIVHREFGAQIAQLDSGDTYASVRTKSELEKFLARLINNNEPGYYYIEPEASAGITGPMCATLALPISFRSEHFEKFKAARIASLDDSFQAKLGWLLGQMYSRVGTRDFAQNEVQKKVLDIVSELAVWLDQRHYEHVTAAIEEEKKANAQKKFSLEDVDRIQKAIPKKKELAIEIILNKAAELGIFGNPSPERRKMRKGLESDTSFAQLFGA